MKVIIFGANGQDGFYLRQLLERQNAAVISVSRSHGPFLKGNVGDNNFVKELISENQPDFIFHLAANSTVSHDALFENHETISTGTINILEAVYKTSPRTRVFISGSALQFENNGHPILETDPFNVTSPYSMSRVQSVYAARYFRHLGVRSYVGYFFHHDSPLRPERHINMKIAKAALRIGQGSAEILEIGNLDVVKEYNFAGDLMEAIWKLVNQDDITEAVVGSGAGHSIREWVDICFRSIGKEWENHVRMNESFKPEFMSLTSNPKSILSLGWQPALGIRDLAAIMMN